MTNRKLVWCGVILGAVLLFAVALYSYTRYHVSRASVISPPVGQFIDIDGTRLHYVRTGSGSPILMIHGLGGMLQDFTSTIVDSLSGNHEIIAFDRAGYGYSDHPREQLLSIDLHARLIHGAVAQLGISRPLVVGHSLGGGIALRYALDYPADLTGLVLLAPAAYPVSRPAQLLGAAGTLPVIGPIFYSTLATPISRLLAPETVRNAFAPDTVPSWYLAQRTILGTRPSQIKSSAEDLAAMNQSLADQSRRYSSLTIPVAIIAGDSDRVLPYRDQALRLHGDIPHSSLATVPNCGHQIQFAHPAEVVALIRRAAGQLP